MLHRARLLQKAQVVGVDGHAILPQGAENAAVGVSLLQSCQQLGTPAQRNIHGFGGGFDQAELLRHGGKGHNFVIHTVGDAGQNTLGVQLGVAL